MVNKCVSLRNINIKVIDKPMDFTTIKNQIEAKDGAGYKNVREICADVRLVFKNAMTYNDDRNDVHVMTKTLLAKFEEKWLLLLPRVIEEETRRKEEEAEACLGMQLAQEAVNVKLARHISNEVRKILKNAVPLTIYFIELKLVLCHNERLCGRCQHEDACLLNSRNEIVVEKCRRIWLAGWSLKLLVLKGNNTKKEIVTAKKGTKCVFAIVAERLGKLRKYHTVLCIGAAV